MAFDALWHEDFAEWPLATGVGAFAGTGWTGNSGAPQVTANANFFSGRGLQWGAGSINRAQCVLPPSTAGLQWCLSWNTIKVSDLFGATTINAGSGFAFLTGTANYWRIVLGDATIGQSSLWILQVVEGGVLTVLGSTPNIFETGVKGNFALHINPVTGAYEFWANNTLVASGTRAAMAGVSAPTELVYGRLGTAAVAGSAITGDFYLYEDSAYIGPREIRSGFPTADDANQDWAFTGGATAWECLNNPLSATPTQYISSAVAGDISDFDAPVDPTNVFGISSMEHRFYAIRTDISAVDMQGRVGDAGGFVNGPTVQPPQASYQFQRQLYNGVNPVSGVGWTTADMLATRIGYERL